MPNSGEMPSTAENFFAEMFSMAENVRRPYSTVEYRRSSSNLTEEAKPQLDFNAINTLVPEEPNVPIYVLVGEGQEARIFSFQRSKMLDRNGKVIATPILFSDMDKELRSYGIIGTKKVFDRIFRDDHIIQDVKAVYIPVKPEEKIVELDVATLSSDPNLDQQTRVKKERKLSYGATDILMLEDLVLGDRLEIVDYKGRRYRFIVIDTRNLELTMGIPVGMRRAVIVGELQSEDPVAQRVIDDFQKLIQTPNYSQLAFAGYYDDEVSITSDGRSTRKRLCLGLTSGNKIIIGEDLSQLPRLNIAISSITIQPNTFSIGSTFM